MINLDQYRIATIAKDFTFAAAHRLNGLPEGHPCERNHGHNYTVRVSFTGYINDVGFVIDYRELDWLSQRIDAELDHRHLNDVMDTNPTAEHIAELLLRWVVEWVEATTDQHRVLRVEVGVSETPKTWATVAADARGRVH